MIFFLAFMNTILHLSENVLPHISVWVIHLGPASIFLTFLKFHSAPPACVQGVPTGPRFMLFKKQQKEWKRFVPQTSAAIHWGLCRRSPQEIF